MGGGAIFASVMNHSGFLVAISQSPRIPMPCKYTIPGPQYRNGCHMFPLFLLSPGQKRKNTKKNTTGCDRFYMNMVGWIDGLDS